jgi:drug/metabolite transporter (DMT)-like permease
MLPILFAFLSVLCDCSCKGICRLRMRQDGNFGAIMILNQLGAGVLLLAVTGSEGLSQLAQPQAWLLLLSGIFWAFFAAADIMTLKYIGLGDSGIVGSAKYLLLVAVGAVVFNEPSSPLRLAGLAIIVFAICINIGRLSLETRRGVVWKVAGLCALIAALALDKYLTRFFAPSLIACIAFLLPGVLFLIGRRAEVFGIRDEVRLSGGWLAVSPLFIALSYLFLVKALQGGELTVASSVLETSPFVTFLFGALVLKERNRLVWRSLAAGLCILGVILVSL